MKSVNDLACAIVACAVIAGTVLPLPAMAAEAENGSATDGINALSTFPEFA